MKIILFGASGMVGQGALRECLLDPGVELVLAVGRAPLSQQPGQQHPKLRELVHPDLFEYESIAPQLTGYDACLFTLGVSSAGMQEDAYTRITYDLTLAAATTLARLNPQMTFLYVSGAHTDSSEQGKSMWARVKGRTENALLRLPFRAAYMFRPGAIQPLHGIRSKTPLYNAIYSVATPLFWVARRWFPGTVTTTEEVGRAMLRVARNGAPKPILESKDIYQLAVK